jgi:hypothetical protein
MQAIVAFQKAEIDREIEKGKEKADTDQEIAEEGQGKAEDHGGIFEDKAKAVLHKREGESSVVQNKDGGGNGTDEERGSGGEREMEREKSVDKYTVKKADNEKIKKDNERAVRKNDRKNKYKDSREKETAECIQRTQGDLNAAGRGASALLVELREVKATWVALESNHR